jgi:tRNA threonylcarbamoyladenosine modification (KEOPS) complex  Pcc1 subunit
MSKIKMNIEFDLKSNELAKKLVFALQPEVSASSEKFLRSSIMIENENTTGKAKLEAIDIIAAKASFNSLMSWINSTLEILEKFS